MAHDIPLPCNAEACSPNGVCCGLDVGKCYCASHCFCANRTTSPGSNHSAPGIWEPGCWCDPGFHGVECSMEMSPTVWLAVILVVGTLLVLFIAWGFRCSDDGDTTVDWDPDGAPGRRGRAPLLREAADRAAAAARPPTEIPSSTDASCTGIGRASEGGAMGWSLQGRKCCCCMEKPLQVVLIPCGHACLCRRCSRRLDQCPLCRLDIQATQRIYFG